MKSGTAIAIPRLYRLSLAQFFPPEIMVALYRVSRPYPLLPAGLSRRFRLDADFRHGRIWPVLAAFGQIWPDFP
jgi:hypothetical protein